MYLPSFDKYPLSPYMFHPAWLWNMNEDLQSPLMWQIMVDRTMRMHNRAATGGKAAKAWSLARFWKIESGGGCGGGPVNWPPL